MSEKTVKKDPVAGQKSNSQTAILRLITKIERKLKNELQKIRKKEI